MQSILLINKESFIKRKKQFFLVGIALLLTTIILSVAISLLGILDKPFDSTFDKLNASHILLLFDTTDNRSDVIATWFSKQKEVESVGEPQPFVIIPSPLIYNDNKIELTVQLTERNAGNEKQDKLHIAIGMQKAQPDLGEIWLPIHFKTTHGLQIGDTLGLPLHGEVHQLKVSAFVTDPHYLSAIFNPTRAWIAPGSLSFLFPLSDLNHVMLGVRLKDKNAVTTVWKRFNASNSYQGENLQYALFKTAFSSFYKILSAVLLFFSIMALVISLLIINTTIQSHIYSDYKQIGILKSLGFTPKNIISVYVSQFALLLLAVIPLGIMAAYFVTDTLIDSVVSSIGISSISYDLGLPFIISGVIVSLLVLTLAFISAGKTGRIKPVDAIRNGVLSVQKQKTKSTSKSSLFRNLPLLLALSIQFLKHKKRSSLLLGFMLASLLFIIVFSINISSSFSRMSNNKTAWGFEDIDVQITRNMSTVLPLSHEQFMELLVADSMKIKNVVPFNYSNLSVLSEDDKAMKELIGKVYSGSISNTGLSNLNGNHPFGLEEISLCIGTSKNFGKDVGDSILVFIEGQRKKFQITGVYQDASTFGQGFRLHENALLELNPLYKPELYGVKLQKNVNAEKFMYELQERLGETVKTELGVVHRKSIIGMVSNVKTAVTIMATFFILIMMLLIYNDTNIDIHQNTITYAKLKSIGYTTKQTRRITVWKFLFLLVFAITLGIQFAFIVGGPIMNALSSGIGLLEFPFSISIGSILVTVIVVIVFSLVSAWMASSILTKIQPRITLNE